ncbi:MAG: deoxyribodipyrimidine photolyase [Planctomycetales bacterium]|nr:deoxyribodipyrimidine photolyase [Planctomycetales bacterium]
MQPPIPELRLRLANEEPVHPQRSWVLYWMTAFRRTRSNFALQYARDRARQLGKPLVILEALRVRYRWACPRFHRFVIEGMVDNAAACQEADVLYYPYVEPRPGAGSGLVRELSQRACLVVSDDYPCFFHPRLVQVASRSLPARLELVDANGLLPLRAAERTFTVAHSYRRWMQKEIPQHLSQPPADQPLDRRSTRTLPVLTALPRKISRRWPSANLPQLLAEGGLSHLPIDGAVAPTDLRGGAQTAEKLLVRFIDQRLDDYQSARNEPDKAGSSDLSAHLHFGHIGAHEIFFRIMQAERWHPQRLHKPNGKVRGFWGVSESSEAFLDQLCTWREIGFNHCYRQPDYDQFESLPSWALKTLDEHADDPRPFVYSLQQFERAETHDPLWNAAQRQLLREGRIHNYLRMLWGKKILHWSKSPRQALDIMLELNNKYALDGRDPNSYSGIFWVLGRFDRAWGPEREIFGKVRYMTSENTARKHPLKQYLQRYSA